MEGVEWEQEVGRQSCGDHMTRIGNHSGDVGEEGQKKNRQAVF
jgi:hypothetical protein